MILKALSNTWQVVNHGDSERPQFVGWSYPREKKHFRRIERPGAHDVLAGREPQAVADPAWRTHAPKEIPA